MNGLPYRLEIRCNPANPVLYLACCGFFDLLGRIDSAACGHWRATAPTAFLLDASLPEADFCQTLLDAFSTLTRWRYKRLTENGEPTVIDVAFAPLGRPDFTVPLDWWFETAKESGEVKDKSAWKMYAGQQTVEKITGDMVSEAVALGKRGSLPNTLTDLLAFETAMSGRFGLDPRSSRNALDVGFSSNDLGLPVNTAPFAELLAVFGLASFFPGRAGRADKLGSCRGWQERKKATDDQKAQEPGFRYCLWSRPLPVALARRAAFRAEPDDLTLLSVRATRKNYSNLTLAQTAPVIRH